MAEKKGDGRRVARAEGEVTRLVAEYLIRHQRGELPGIVSVSRVKMSADLRHAKVFISAIGASEQAIAKVLKSWAPEVQRYVGEHLPMRYCPKLMFLADDVSEKVQKIDNILHEISKSKASASDDSEES